MTIGFLKKYVLLFLIAQSSFSQKITRGPYLQNPTPTGITIKWITETPTVGKVILKENGNSYSENFTSMDHEIVIDDLDEDRIYHYQIIANELIISESANQYFKINPSNTSGSNVKFWVTGDFGASNTIKYKINQQEVKDAFLAKEKKENDLWLWLGDNAYCCGTQYEYQSQVFDFYGESIFGNTPILPSPGNHEYLFSATARQDHQIPYFDIINVPQNGESGGVPSNHNAYYSLDYGNIHFISLDSYGYGEDGLLLAVPKSIQYQWLENDLKNNKQKWTVIFFHHPIYTKRSHDSDFEAELRNLRRGLVPMFDLYNVDLILNGHSHIYERSHLIKNHVETSDQFDFKTHVVQATSGKYTESSKPYINKREGSIYMTVGSAGRLDWNTTTIEHPTSVYSNYVLGGSSVFEVKNNRLNSRWIAADGNILDSFTIFKDVNLYKTISVKYGDQINLTASWEGKYNWPDDIKERSVNISPRKDTIVIVKDDFGYLADTFNIKITAKPEIKCIFNSQGVCTGEELSLQIQTENISQLPSNTTLFLEKKVGNSVLRYPLGLLKEGFNTITLNDTISAGDNFTFVPTSNDSNIIISPSSSFELNQRATAKFANSFLIPYSDVVELTIEVQGGLPAKLKINTLDPIDINSSPVSLSVSANKSLVYYIESISNSCGEGVFSNQLIEIQTPLATEAPQLEIVKAYPNPAKELLIVETSAFNGLKGTLNMSTINGTCLYSKELTFSNSSEIITANWISGIYILTFKTKNLEITKKIVLE